MATKNFYVHDGLKVKGNSLLNGSTFSDSASAKLHVKTAANGASANLSNVNGLIIENSGSSNSNYALKLATGAGNILNVSNAGRVGIGTTIADAALHVEDDLGIKLSSSNGGTNNIFAPGSTGLEIQVGNGDVAIGVKNSNRYVGIGTTNPNEELTVVGDISASGNIYGNIADLEFTDLTVTGDLSVAGDSTFAAVTASTICNTGDITVTGDVEADEFIGALRGAVSFTALAGEALSKGDVVYISGISGTQTVVAKADADDTSKMPAFGVASETVNLNANVTIYTFGTLSNVDTSLYPEGTELFVSTTAGGVLSAAPTGESAQIQKIAKVTRQHGSSGSMKIMGAGRSNATPNLNEGRLFVGNSSNQAVADSTIHVDIANSEVGINNVSPDRALHVKPTSNVPAIKVGYDGTQGNGSLLEFDNGYTQKFYVGMSDTYASRDFVIAEISTGSSTDATNPKYVFNGNGDGSFYITDAADNDIKVLLNTNGDSYLSGGNVGIGITSPTDLLDLHSTTSNSRLLRLSHPTSPGQAAGFLGYNTGNSIANLTFTLGVQYSSTYYNVINIRRDTQNVGIGTLSPNYKLHTVGGAGVFDVTGAATQNHHLAVTEVATLPDWRPYAGTTTSALQLQSSATRGILLAAKSTGNQDFYNTDGLDIYVASTMGSSSSNRGNLAMSILSGGNVGIGTASPNEKLTVSGNVSASGVIYADTFCSNSGSCATIDFNDNLDVDGYITATQDISSQGCFYTSSGSNVALLANNYLRSCASGTFYFDHATVGQSFQFRTSSSSALDTTAMTITSAGYVGLGVIPTNQRLTLNGNFLLYNNKEIRQLDTGGLQRTIIKLDSSNDLNIGGSYSGALKFIGGGSYSEVMRIHDDGNVGIGITAPEAPLHILGGYDANNPKSLVISGREDASAVYSGVQFERAGGGTFFGIGNDSRTDRDEIVIGGGFGSVTNASSIKMYTGGLGCTIGTTRMVITSSGSVGFGTNAPNQSFTVATGRANFDEQNNYYGVWIDGDTSAESFIGVGSWHSVGGRVSDEGGNHLSLRTHNTSHNLCLQCTGGATVIGGAATICGTATFHGSLDLQDNDKLLLGSGNDLEIYHNGSDSYISDVGTGHLILATNSGFLVKSSTEKLIEGYPNGAVSLYYDNSKKLETTSAGVCITDDVQIAGNLIVHGTCSTLNTTVTATSAMCIHNAGTGPALQLNQTGSQPIVDLQDDGTSAFYIEDGGNVGIGTNNPAQKLHVCATAAVCAQVQSNSNHAAVEIISPESTYSPYLRFKDNCGERYVAYSDTDHKLHFRPSGTSTQSEWITFSQNGRLGLGTSVPRSKLFIAGGGLMLDYGTGGSTDGAALRINSNSNEAFIQSNAYYSTAVKHARAGASSRIQFKLDATNGGDITFSTAPSAAADANMSQTERMTIKQGGNVGIGSTNPGAKLDIHAGTNTNGILIREDTDDSITHNLYIDGDDDGVMLMYSNGQSGKVQLHTAGCTFFNGGNVGIGTGSACSKLHVYGSGEQNLIVGSSNGGRTLITLDGAGNGDGAGGDYAYLSHNADGAFDIKNLQNNSIRLATGSSGTTRMTITSAGDVGIGDSSPVVGLSLYGDSNKSRIKLANTSGHQVNIGLWDNSNYRIEGDANRPILITSYDTDGGVRIGASGSADMTVVGGEVGIGTTDPGAKLDVSLTNTTNTGITLSNSCQAWAQLHLKQHVSKTHADSLSGHSAIFTTDPDGSSTWPFNTTDGEYGALVLQSRDSGNSGIVLRTGTGSGYANRLVVRESGNVGIGITNPSYPLDVVGYVNSSIGYRAGNYTILNESGNETSFGNTAYYGVSFKTNNAVRMKIANDGNVGIGTTSPTDKLHVVGNFKIAGNINPTADVSYSIGTSSLRWLAAYTARLLTGDGSASAPGITFINDTDTGLFRSGNDILNFATAGSERMRIDATGNVGIGTTDPGSAKLHIAGSGSDVKFTIDRTDARTYSIYTESNSSLRIKDEDAGADRLTILSDGNVGIGTATPATKLTVYNSSGNVLTLLGQSAANVFNVGATGVTQITGATGSTVLQVTNSGSGDYMAIGSCALLVKKDGDVGIGVSPTTRLHVSNPAVGQSGSAVTSITTTQATDLGVKLSFTGGDNSNGNIIGGIALGNGGEEYAGLYAIDGGSSAATDLAFFAGDTNGINEAIRIDSSGTVTFNSAYSFPTADGSAGQVLTTDGNGALSFSSAGSGTISGSGTDNYIPRFNGTTALENSSIYDDGTNIGIGSTSPTAPLDIYSDASDAPLRVGSPGIWSGINFRDCDGNANMFFRGSSCTWSFGGGGSSVSGKRVHVDGGATIGANYDACTMPTNGLLVEGSVGIGTTCAQPYSSLFAGKLVVDTSTCNLDGIFSTTNHTNAAELILTKKNSTNNYGSLVIQHAGTSGDAIAVNYSVNTTTGSGGTNSFKVTTDGCGYFKNNVGIGTTTPGCKLDVINGAIRISSSGETKLHFRETVATDTYADRWTIGNDDAINNGFVISCGANFDTPRLVVLDTGNVGIGITNPSGLLHVKNGEFTLNSSSAYTSHFNYQNTGTHFISMANSGYTYFRGSSNGCNPLTVFGGGKIGVNNTNPGKHLDVVGEAKIDTSANNAPALCVSRNAGVSSVSATGAILTNTAVYINGNEDTGSDALRIGSMNNGTGDYFIDASNYNATAAYDILLNPFVGNVGIGTTNPGYKLDVAGDARINDSGAANGTASETMRVVNTAAGATSSYVYIGASSGTDWKLGKNVPGTLSRTNFDITTHAGVLGLTINTGGCVGVGTTDTTARLDVRGTATDGQELLRLQSSGNVTDGGYHWMTSEMATGQTTDANIIHLIGRAECSKNSGYFGFNYQADGADSNFLTLGGYAANNLLNITMGGDVGIATTQPNVKLHVSGGDVRIGNGNKVYLYESNDVNYLAYNRWEVNTSTALAINNAGTGGFQVQDSGTAVLFVGTDSTYGGRVGIGTTNPSHTLQVNGETKSTHFITGYDWTAKTGGIQIGNDGLTTGAVSFYNGSSGSSGNIYRDSDILYVGARGGTSTQGLAIDNAGQVGINTATPYNRLHVNGNARINGLIVGNSAANNTPGACLHIKSSGTAASLRIEDLDSTNQVYDFLVDQGVGFKLIDKGTGSSTNTRLAIDTSGNVGIGTDSPNSKTDIVTGSRSCAFSSSDGTTWHDLIVRNPDSTQNAAVGLAFELNGTYHTNAGTGIAAVKEVGNGDYGAGLAFVTRPQSAAAVERVRITSTGAVGIGTTCPGASNSGKLYVGTPPTTGSSAIAQFGGFVRSNFFITHDSNNGIYPNTNYTGSVGIGTRAYKCAHICKIIAYGGVCPADDGQRPLGGSSYRWSNVHAVCTTTGAVIESNLCTPGIDSCPQGSVVVWRDGKLQGTTQEYDYNVMGVTAPDTESPIVMGAEPILVTGDIQEGDPIVTSSKINHGMKGDRACDLHGKVIAQALENGSGESYMIQGMIRKF